MTSTMFPSTSPTNMVPSSHHAIRPQRFSTLLRVELRKLTDTRSGKVLFGSAVTLTVGLLVWKLFHTSSVPVEFSRYNASVQPAVSLLLPVLGLLAMTSEWTQRTALTTFTLSPRRLRVFGAKFGAALVLGIGVLLVTVPLSLAATALGGVIGDGATYANAGGEIRATVIATLLQVVMGAAFGALIPVTAAALGAFFAAPTVWAAFAPEVLKDNSRWLDIFEAYDRLASNHPTHHLAQTLTAIAAWVLLPAAIGLYRSVRREVK